jgi:integrase
MRRVRDLDQASDLYIGELARRGCTQSTRLSYQRILWAFSARYDELAPWEVTADDCRRFLDRWVDCSPSTLAQYVSILRGFFAFLLDEEIVEANPMERIRRPPRKRPEELDVVTIQASDVDRLYAACQEWDELLCLAILTYLGPRRNAAALARRGDVDLEHGTLRLHEKGGKVMVKPLPDELVEIIRTAERAGIWTSPRDYLIPNRRAPRRDGERSNKVVYAIVKRIAARIGIEAHPHALRAAFAVRFDEQTSDVMALKDLLGHTRLETTQVYLRRRQKQVKMEKVRGLSWGSVLQPLPVMPPTGFEPVLQP